MHVKMNQFLLPEETLLEAAHAVRPLKHRRPLLIQWDLGEQPTGLSLVLLMMDIQGDMNYYLNTNLLL